MKNHFYISDIRTKDFNSYPLLSLTMSGIKERNTDSNEGQLAESYEKYNLVDSSCIIFNPMDLISGWVDIPNIEGLISPSYIAIKAKSKKINVIERKIKPEEMSNFVGCFLTGTAAEITPVSQIDKFNFDVCELIKDLSESYQKLVRKKVAA